MNKLIVILGPTSSGKSSLAIKLAKKFHGEIISADSRQVYKGMDIGTGKVTKKEQTLVPHHLLDVASPKKQFSVSDYKHLTLRSVEQIVGQGKIPFLVGGTAFYIYSVIDNWQIPEVAPNPKFRQLYEQKSLSELVKILKKLDPARAKTIDRKNKRRLIRALEIIKASGHPVPKLHPYKLENVRMLILGIKKEPSELKRLIRKRVEQRFEQGLIVEVKKLMRQGVSVKRLSEIGLTYRLVAEYLKKPIPKNTLVEKITNAEYQYSRRQMTWFQRDNRIRWIKNQKVAERFIKNFTK